MLIQLLIIQIITFTGLLILLRILFARNLKAALERLNALHEENLAKEVELTEELKRAKEERDAQVQKGKTEAQALLEEAKQEAINLRLKMEGEAKLKAEKILLQGQEEAQKLKEELSKEMQNLSITLAVEMIEEAFTEQNKEDLQVQFTNEIIEELAKLPQDKFSVASHNIKVISSHPLRDEQRKNLKRVLSAKLGFSPELEESVNKELISGLVLEMNGLVIDGTLKNKLRRIIPYLKK